MAYRTGPPLYPLVEEELPLLVELELDEGGIPGELEELELLEDEEEEDELELEELGGCGGSGGVTGQLQLELDDEHELEEQHCPPPPPPPGPPVPGPAGEPGNCAGAFVPLGAAICLSFPPFQNSLHSQSRPYLTGKAGFRSTATP